MLAFISALSAIHNSSSCAIRHQQQPSVYSQVISDPTGRNAYEDYARAADMVISPSFNVFVNWPYDGYDYYKDAYDGAPTEDKAKMQEILDVAGELKDKDFLEAQREWVQRYRLALDTVREGLLKPVWQPRARMDADTLFPEYMGFKNTERLFVGDAYVNFADGNTEQATQDLIDGLRFADHMPSGPLIGPLVSMAMASMVFKGIDGHMSRIPLDGWQTLAELCKKHLEDNSLLVDCLKSDKQMLDNTLSKAAATPGELSEIVPGAPIDNSGGDSTGILSDAKAYADQYYSDAIQRFSGTEDQWQTNPPAWDGASLQLPQNPTRSERVAALVDSVTVDFNSLARNLSRSRTQWRILRVHALIQSYRWENGNLPSNILDAANADDLIDPLSGQKLMYVRLDDERYRLFSRGTADLGEVDLVYHAPPPTKKPTEL